MWTTKPLEGHLVLKVGLWQSRTCILGWVNFGSKTPIRAQTAGYLQANGPAPARLKRLGTVHMVPKRPVLVWHISRPSKGSCILTLGPMMYVLSYMDPLGFANASLGLHYVAL